MSHFPARDLDEPVTKEFHRAESATQRAEMAASYGELRAEIAASAGELRAEIAELRVEVGDLRTEMRVGFADVRTEMHRGVQRMTLSLAALVVSMSGGDRRSTHDRPLSRGLTVLRNDSGHALLQVRPHLGHRDALLLHGVTLAHGDGRGPRGCRSPW